MPNLYERGKRVYVAPRLFTFDPGRFLTKIDHEMQAAVNSNIARAKQVADARVPVRRVFKGGRQNTRRLTRHERMAEAREFISTLSVDERTRIAGTARATNQSLEETVAGMRANVRTRVGWNRQNRWIHTDVARQVRPAHMTPGLPGHGGHIRTEDVLRFTGSGEQWEISPGVRKRLNKSGTAALRNGRVYWDAKNRMYRPSRSGNYIISIDLTDKLRPTFTIGGNLKRSIRIEEGTSDTGPSAELVAGGEDAPYAKYVEFGTRHAAAQPFLRPAYAAIEERFIADVRRRLLTELPNLYPVR